MPDDKFPKPKPEIFKPKSLEDWSPEELGKNLFVAFAEGVDPEDFIKNLNKGQNLAFVVGNDGGIFLGMGHYTLSRGMSGSEFDLFVNDGRMSNKRAYNDEFFYQGSWSLSSPRLASKDNTVVKKAIGEKMMAYLKSKGADIN